jgi:hypothetical protein
MKYISDWQQQDKNKRDLKTAYANKRFGTLKYHIILLITQNTASVCQLFTLALACTTLYLVGADIVSILLGIIGAIVILIKHADW